eukprot:scaffold218651_cov30-Tisochrysis_lutea.AAC.2
MRGCFGLGAGRRAAGARMTDAPCTSEALSPTVVVAPRGSFGDGVSPGTSVVPGRTFCRSRARKYEESPGRRTATVLPMVRSVIVRARPVVGGRSMALVGCAGRVGGTASGLGVPAEFAMQPPGFNLPASG